MTDATTRIANAYVRLERRYFDALAMSQSNPALAGRQKALAAAYAQALAELAIDEIDKRMWEKRHTDLAVESYHQILDAAQSQIVS